MEKNKKRTLWNFAEHFEGDKVVWIIMLLLILASIVCMFSSTSRLLKEGETRIDLVRNQFSIIAVGLAIIIFLYNIKNIRFFRSLSKLGFPLSLTLLVLLVSEIDLPFLKSMELNGARRILSVKGQQLHVYEAVKVMMIMYLAWAIDAFKKGELKGPQKDIWKKILYIYGPFLLITGLMIPGSNSAALLVGGIMFLVILFGGGSFKDLSILFVSFVILIASCYGIYEISGHKSMTRIGTGIARIFHNTDAEAIYLGEKTLDDDDLVALKIKRNADGTLPPETKIRQAALDKMRQPVSAKIAIKEGGLIGKGPGQSTQRYVVPDISEDFMFSFIIEEYGLIGGIIIIVLYMSLMARGALIARNCNEDLYAKLCVAGLTLLISGQAFLHIFVNAGIGPMTGQTLPLISHGNFAFVCFSIAFGVILSFSRIAARRIERETREAAPLMEMHEEVESGLNDLDDFESGLTIDDEQLNDYDEI